MRSIPGSYDLSFILPRGLDPRAWRFRPEDGLEFDGGLVRVTGASRETAFERGAALVRTLPRQAPLSIAAILHTPERPSGFDRWSIIIGADVAFSPTALDPHFPRPPA